MTTAKKAEAVTQTCSLKKVFLEISQNSQESTCARVSFLIKLQLRPATLLKKRLWHKVFSCEFWKISKNTFFHRITLVAASKKVLNDSPYQKTPEIAWFFINFLYFSFTYISNSLTIQVQPYEVTRYFVQQNKIATTFWKPH